MKRACGILLPIFSLPGNYGIGCFSVKAYEFVDTLKKAGQTYWQILPLGPTGYGDSPYQAFSSFAGNPYFIDLDELAAEGLLDEQELRDTNWGTNPRYVDYGKIWESREKMLRKAFAEFRKILDGSTTQKKKKSSKPVLPDAPAAQNLLNQKGYDEARKKLNPETREFCLYRAVKNSQGGKSWTESEDALRLRKPKTLDAFRKEHAEEIEFYEWVQIVFEFQWRRLRQYANVHGIRIIGDMPIYVSPDSSDAWSHPELFQFDENAKPVKVAGCPPDYFSPDGQLWGNPLYDWKYHKKTDYEWWMNRMEYALTMYDIVRVDHFRGFDEYFAIPADAKTAKDGKWEKGPGMDLFRKMQKHFEDRFPELPIIAEDLGLMTDSVIKLVKDSGFPAMKVLEFAYDSDNKNLYLPHMYIRNCVAYTGTHDNEPLMSWIRNQNGETRLHMIRYQGSEHTPEGDLYWDCIRTVLSSVADTVIIPMWDYLGAGPEARVNTPSMAGGNWQWRMQQGEFGDHLVWHCGMLADMYNRERTAALPEKA